MSLYGELKRRNVFRVTAAYVVVGWLILQLAEIVLGFIGAPDWVGKAIIALLVLGFVPALAIAWVFEVTDDGVVVDDGQVANGNGHRARKLDIITLVAVVFVAGIAFYEHLKPPVAEPDRGASTAPTEERALESAPTDPVTVAAIEITPNSIAVLPFANRSAEPDTAFFVDGVHDDLLTQLARVSELKVISRTSVMEYRDTTKNMRQIGEELGVATILEGAVQRAGDRVRINAQLIDSQTDEHLWADTFDRELTAENIFDIQSDIARAIATALVSTLTPEEVGAAISATAPTESSAAYDLFLQGRAQSGVYDPGSIARRIDLYQRALQLDPEFALAMGELAYELTNDYWFQSRDPGQRDLARRHIDRALELAPGEPRLHWIMADHLYHGELDYEGALAQLVIAERGLPGSAEVYAMRGWILRRSGDIPGAIAAFEQAARLDPRNQQALTDLGFTLALDGRMAEARAWFGRLDLIPNVADQWAYFSPLVEFWAAANPEPMREYLAGLGDSQGLPAIEQFLLPYYEGDLEAARSHIGSRADDPFLYQWRVWPKSFLRAMVAHAAGDEIAVGDHADEALADIEAFLQEFPEDARAHSTKATTLALLGQHDEARRFATRARELYPPSVDVLSSQMLELSEIETLALFVDSEELAVLVEAYLNRPWPQRCYTSVMWHPFMARHRDHPSFVELRERYAADCG